MKTNAQDMAQKIALDVIKAYNLRVQRYVMVPILAPEEREQAQSDAIKAAQVHVDRLSHVTEPYWYGWKVDES